MTNVFDVLVERGFVASYSEPLNELRSLFGQQITVYQGFDPTASSLHCGHLESLMALHHLQAAGHRVIFLVGGATALVGDPSGRNDGRTLLSYEDVNSNAQALQRQVQRIGLLDFASSSDSKYPEAVLLNNAAWLDMSLVLYLREVAVHFSVNEMLRRETFASRLNNQRNLSLLELLYPTLQAYDFVYLNREFDCLCQLGGNDQLGNIYDGIDLVRRINRRRVHALTFPLLLDGNGQKMGKTAQGEAIWLDPSRTSPFAFYQYWLTTADADLARNFALFTFLDMEEIGRVVSGNPRQAQHRLAYEVTQIVHGPTASAQAQEDAQAAFGLKDLVPQGVPTLRLTMEQLSTGTTVVQALHRAGVVPSMSAARRLIQQGGIRLNGEKLGRDTALDANSFQYQYDEPVALVQHGRGKVLKLTLKQ